MNSNELGDQTMTMKSNDLEPTLAEAFEVGKKEGLREAFTEIKSMIQGDTGTKELKIYIEARLRSVQDFSLNNPFKQKE